VEFASHAFEDGVGVEEEGVPIGGVVQLEPHLPFACLFEGGFLFHCVAVLLFDFGLEDGFFACFDDGSDVFERGFDVYDASKDDFVVEGGEGAQGLFWFFVGEEEVAFGLVVVLFGQFDFGDVAETGEGGADVGLFEDVGDVGDVESVRIDLERFRYELLVLFAYLRSFDRFYVDLWLLGGGLLWDRGLFLWRGLLLIFGLLLLLLFLLELLLDLLGGHEEVVP
jgi:hypothetical protein